MSTKGKIHVNMETGAVGRCEAEKEPCPFGEANHFDTYAQGHEAYQRHRASDTLVSHSRRADPYDTFANSSSPRAQAYQRADAAHREAVAAWESKDEDMARKKENNRYYKGTREWQQDTKERKDLYFKQLRLQQERRALLPDDLREKELKDEAEQAEKDLVTANAWKNEGGTYNYHPEITPKNQWRPRKTLAAFTGRPESDVNKAVAFYQKQGMDLTDAYRAAWGSATMRTDRPIVSLDLETAAPMIKGKVDSGDYSTIIEVGYVKRYPDGTVEQKNFLCGLPPDVKSTIGTGAEHIHNISVDMVEGKKPLQEDSDTIREIVQDIDGCVIVAHNALYEKGQLSAAIPGFAEHERSGRVQMLDTREVSQWFQPENETNTNGDFTTNNGVAYENAHRALDDAKMTFKALLNSKGLDSSQV